MASKKPKVGSQSTRAKTGSSSQCSDQEFAEIDADLRRVSVAEIVNKPICVYGQKCYRKNQEHFEKYRHLRDDEEEHRSGEKRNDIEKKSKITDFFNKTPRTSTSSRTSTSPRTSTSSRIMPVNETNGNKKFNRHNVSYEIEDSSEEEEGKSRKEKIEKEMKEKSPVKTKKNGNKVDVIDYEYYVDESESEEEERRNRRSPVKTDKAPSNTELKTSSRSCSTPKHVQNKRKPNTSSYFSKTQTKVAKYEEEDKPSGSRSDSPNKSISPYKSSQFESTSPKPKLSPEQLNVVIKDIFLFEMPPDFFQLWQFCKSIKYDAPQYALKETLDLTLTGPFDVLTGVVKKSNVCDSDKILTHWRYFYDPPEFQTLIRSNSSNYHIGYFRDEPNDSNPIVVSNDGKTCEIKPVSDNIIAAVYSEILKKKSHCEDTSTSKKLAVIEKRLKMFCERFNVKMINANDKMKARKKKVNAKTFNNFGIVVPVDAKSVGYRPLTVTDANLKKMLIRICKADVGERDKTPAYRELKELIGCVNYANDELDFGMGLELGIDLFSFGDPFFHSIISFALSTAYQLLNRNEFARILEAHLENRRSDSNLSVI